MNHSFLGTNRVNVWLKVWAVAVTGVIAMAGCGPSGSRGPGVTPEMDADEVLLPEPPPDRPRTADSASPPGPEAGQEAPPRPEPARDGGPAPDVAIADAGIEPDAPGGAETQLDGPPPPDAPPDTPLPVELTKDLRLYLKLDEVTGTTYSDSSPAGNNASIIGAPARPTTGCFPAMFPNPACYDGTGNAYVAAGTNMLPAANAPQSISAWIRYGSIPLSGTFVFVALSNPAMSSYVKVGFRNGNVSAWKFAASSQTLAGFPAPVSAAWHHVVYTFDGTTHRIFFDGTERASSTVAPNTAPVTAASIGGSPSVTDAAPPNPVEEFGDRIDDVRVYSRALNVAEIAALRMGRAM